MIYKNNINSNILKLICSFYDKHEEKMTLLNMSHINRDFYHSMNENVLYICLEKKYNKVQKYIPDSIKTKYKKSIGRQYVEFCLIACEFCGTSLKG